MNMKIFRKSYMNAMTEATVSNTGPSTNNMNMLRSVWQMDLPKARPEEAPNFVETDIYRTGNGGAIPSRRRVRSRKHSG